MKKLIALLLALVMCFGLVACGGPAEPSQAPVEPTPAPTPDPTPVPEDTLADAVAYVKTIYKKVAEITAKDYERIGVVPVGAEKYEVVWTVDVAEDLVKIVKNENGMVTVDVNEGATEEVAYVLTATITGKDGKTESLSWNHILPASMDVDGLTYAEIVELAYALEDQASTEDAFRLYGTVTSIDTPWSDDYQNITVTIAVAGKEDKPIQCYRLKGEGAKDLKVGDQITVEGVLKNYKGTYEFDAGCQLIGFGEHVDQKALLKAAFALGEGASMDYPAVLTGVIDAIPSAWSDEYGNITVNMLIDGQIVQAYRLSGEGAKDLAVGQTITVAGVIKNYKGTIEFDQGCKLIPNELYHSIKNALSGYKLLDGEAQEGTKTITGTITAIDTPWSEDYQNITVTIVVGGAENYPIMCYRLKGEGAKDLAVGQTITVTGTLKNYKGTIEFDAGCTLDSVGGEAPAPQPEPTPEPDPEPDPEPVVAPTNPADIVAAAYALENGASLPYTATLTGEISAVDTPWSDQYGNITVTITAEGKAIMCYRLKGDGAKDLKVGDTITVTGTLKNYNGTIEFDAGCKLDKVVAGSGSSEPAPEPTPEPGNPQDAYVGTWIVHGFSLDGTTGTFTGVEGQVFVFTDSTIEYLIGGAPAGKWNYTAELSTDGKSDVTFQLTGPSSDIWCFINQEDGTLLIFDVGLSCYYHCSKQA